SPILLPSGEHVVVFLVHAPRTSSLTKALPQGPTYHAPTQGRMGVLASTSAESNAETAALVARWAALASGTTDDAAARAAATRALACDEVGAGHPVVVEDGAQAVAALPDLAATLDDAERRRLAAAIARRDLPPRVRIALVQAIADQRLVALVPSL